MSFMPRSLWLRALLGIPLLAAVAGLLWWRGPDWNVVYHAFDLVNWAWVAFALGLNLISVLLRSLAWKLTIDQALEPPQPRFIQVFSAFSVGMLGNAVLPDGSGSSRGWRCCDDICRAAGAQAGRSSGRSSHTGSSMFPRRCC